MALVHCRECGEKISEQALNCPKCGAPQNQQNKKGNNKGLLISLIIILIGILGVGGYIFLNADNPESQNTPENSQERIEIANRVLSNNCKTLTNMSTEFIKDDLVASLTEAFGNVKCDCIKEKLVQKLAEKYTLSKLKELENQPIHQIAEIKKLIEENNEELKGCFPLINQVKDAVIK